MSLDWETVDRRARSGDQAGVARLFLEATEAERLGFARPFEAGLKSVDPDVHWRARVDPAPGYVLAVIGVAPSAARAATLLLRRGLRDAWPQVQTARLLQIAEARQLDWLGDLGLRLAARLPTRDVWDGEDWAFTARLLQAGETPPPVTEGVVRGWLARLIRPRAGRMPPLTDRMHDDPHLDLLLPAVFEIDGLGADIVNATAGSPESVVRFHQAVAALVAEGRLERKPILAATVDRLSRGDKPHALRPFVLLHDELAPTADEIAAHALDYARLLADGPGAVAAVAQRCLRTLDDTGRLDVDTLLEAGSTALLRTEKALVKAQISWLERVARREPERAGDVSVAMAAAFGHPALDVQERALTLIAKRLPGLAPDTVARLAEASTALSGDLPARAAALFGTTVRAEAAPELPAPAGPAPMPPPISTAAELAEEIAILVHDGTGVRWERVLAALVVLHTDGGPEPLAATLPPLLDRYPDALVANPWNEGSALACLGAAITMATGPAGHDRTHRRLHAMVRTAWQEGRRGGSRSPLSPRPDGVLALRVAEIAVHLNGSMMPMLVATPTCVNGSLDPAVLLDRLSRAEAEGWQPWSFDLEQALLRLPRNAAAAAPAGTARSNARATGVTAGAAGVTARAAGVAAGAAEVNAGATGFRAHAIGVPAGATGVTAAGATARTAEVAAGAAGLTSPAGRQFAQWLASGGLPDPVSETVVQRSMRHETAAHAWDRPVKRRVVGRLRPARDGGLRLERQLLTLDPPDRILYTPDDLTGAEGPVAMVLPHHREVAAAWALGEVAALADQDQHGAGRLLPLLAECAGPIGPALTTAIAYALCAKQEADRAAAVDAFLTLAAGPEPFAAAVGAALGDLCSDGTAKANRAVPALTDASRAGATAAVWELLTTALPPLLRAGHRATPDLLGLATQIAVTTGARAEISGLAEAAARPGSSRLVQEARRLHSTLSPA